MPYLTKEQVSLKREEIKKMFPDFKFSITRRHHSEIVVVILEAPMDLLNGSDKKYENVNNYWIDSHYAEFPETRDILNKIQNIMDKDNGVLVEDGDYGTVPNFYTSLSIGNWEKPFKVSKPSEKKTANQTINTIGHAAPHGAAPQQNNF